MTRKIRMVTKRRKDKPSRYYYYVNRQAEVSFYISETPHLHLANPWDPDFAAAYADATRLNHDRRLFGWLVEDYQRSPRFKRLAKSTRDGYAVACDAIMRIPFKSDTLAARVPLHILDSKRALPYIIDWHAKTAERSPRLADIHLGVLSNILEHGRKLGVLDFNRAGLIDSAYQRPIDEAAPWDEVTYLRFIGDGCPEALALALRAVRAFGLRRTDLSLIPVTAPQGNALIWHPSKGRRVRRRVVAAITPEGRSVITDALAFRQKTASDATTLLVNGKGEPWKPSSLDSAFQRRRSAINAKVKLHDLRKNHATDLVLAHVRDPKVITRSIVCRQMGWGEEQLDEMIRIYVDDSAVVAALTGQSGDEIGNDVETATVHRLPKRF